MRCPTHGDTMVYGRTRWGGRWACEITDCTVVCWAGSTSTPADQETRNLRQQCHKLFDGIWGPGKRFPRRGDAYRWLKNLMGVHMKRAHIGMFDRAQCEKLIRELGEEPNPEYREKPEELKYGDATRLQP